MYRAERITAMHQTMTYIIGGILGASFVSYFHADSCIVYVPMYTSSYS